MQATLRLESCPTWKVCCRGEGQRAGGSWWSCSGLPCLSPTTAHPTHSSHKPLEIPARLTAEAVWVLGLDGKVQSLPTRSSLSKKGALFL